MTIEGSLVHLTDTGTAIRGWLISVITGSRMPFILELHDQPYGGEVAKASARAAANAAGTPCTTASPRSTTTSSLRWPPKRITVTVRRSS